MPPTSPAATGTRAVTGWLAGKDWTVIPTSRRVVALTFDAGANADAVPSILATRRREDVPATFFLTGNFVRDFPAAARSIAAAGFRIGDHTVSHPYLTRLSDAAVREEILGGATQIAAVTGRNPAPLFRFPFRDADARTIAIANQAGYVPVRWTVDTLGWEETAGHITVAVVASRALAAASSPACSLGPSVSAPRVQMSAARNSPHRCPILFAMRPRPGTDQALVLSVLRDGLRPPSPP